MTSLCFAEALGVLKRKASKKQISIFRCLFSCASSRIDLAEFGEMIGHRRRIVYYWLDGRRRIPAEVLNYLGDILQDDRDAVLARGLPRLAEKRRYILPWIESDSR
jgi:hypothetical protein